ncbi:hypothetical protein AN1V17_49420 [Vallitalea sediminicola]
MDNKINNHGDKHKCSKCGEWIDNKSRNCKYCGAFISKTSRDYKYEFKSTDKFKPETVIKDKKICRYCGEPNNINAVVCYNCNQQLNDAEVIDKSKDYGNKYITELNIRDDKIKKIRILYFFLMFVLVTIVMVLTMIRISHINSNLLSNEVWSAKISLSKYIIRYIFGYIILFITIIDNFFPEALFFLHATNLLMVKDAEPSEYYFIITRISSYLFSFGMLIYFVCIYWIL